jgi:DNA-binding transcriptional LysR family regulator
MDATTIDHFAVFIAVVDEGSFAAAARRLNRPPAAIIEAIRRLEVYSQLPLFDRAAFRASLTEAGEALLPRARQIVEDAEDFSLTAREIASGLEASVALAIDALTPLQPVVDTLKAFSEAYPSVQIRLSLETFESAAQALSDGSADLGVMSSDDRSDEVESKMCGAIRLVPVAAPDHPVLMDDPAATINALRHQVQLVLSTRSALRDKKLHGVISVNRWYLSDLETKHALLLAGLGWGFMPHHRVAADLASGRLAEILSDQWDDVDQPPVMPFVVAYRRGRALGPAARWLFRRLEAANAPPPTTETTTSS